MRIIIDTNIFIYRENNHILSDELQHLLKILNSSQINEILIHPKIVEEINRDLNENRKKISISKLNTYPLLKSPPDPKKDRNFSRIVGIPSKINDEVDNAILYSVYKNAVDFLITEDINIHKKAIRLDIEDRVLCIEEGIRIFEKDISKEEVIRPPALKEDFIYNIDINDPIFQSLKEEYEEFNNWFNKISREGRKCWVHYRKGGTIGALLIYKIENEPIDSIPPLPLMKRLKIATLKVVHTGYKIGELFTKLAVDFSIKNDITEIYLTHLFHFHLPNPLKLENLKTIGIFAPQSIAQISDDKYLKIKTRGGIDERFTIS